jgi:zinc and cadmium transporter
MIQMIAGVGVVSLTSFAGILLISRQENKAIVANATFLAFATGTLLGTTLFHLIPECLELLPAQQVGQNMAFAILALLGLEIALKCRHRSHEKCSHPKPFVWVNLIGDGIHNFIDGALLASCFMASPTLGWGATLAFLAHEFPQELSDYLILRNGGLSTKKALGFNLLSACAAFVGAILVTLLNEHGHAWVDRLLPFAAGSFLYLALADLLPEFRKKLQDEQQHWLWPMNALMFGMLLMGILATYGPGHAHL